MNTPIDITGITLTTKRLILRPWKKKDLEDFFEYAHVDGVGQMAGWLPHKTLSALAISAVSWFVNVRERTLALL